MAVQKKKTVKKSKKPKVEPKKDIQPDSYFVTMMVGYLVLLAGVILLLGCVTISIVGEQENWLGIAPCKVVALCGWVKPACGECIVSHVAQEFWRKECLE